MKNSIELKRLRELKKILLAWDSVLKPQGVKFNMAVWKKDKDKDCGAAACAFGIACVYKPFIRDGLKLRLFGRDSEGRKTYVPTFGKSGSFSAAAEFFGITWDEAREIFHPIGYGVKNPKPHHVAARLDKLIKTYEASHGR